MNRVEMINNYAKNKTNEQLIDIMVSKYHAYVMTSGDKYFDQYYECRTELLKRLNKEDE